jgi:hypothetical protein
MLLTVLGVYRMVLNNASYFRFVETGAHRFSQRGTISRDVAPHTGGHT